MLTTGFRHSLLCSLVAFTCMGHSLHSTLRTMSVDVRHSEGGGVGYSQSYTSLDGFFGYDGDNYIPFLDARGHVFNDGKFAANIGIGARGLYESACLALGGNVFYDFRNTHRHSYNQIGVGFEVIKSWWEIHVNGYFPVGTKKSRFFNYREKEFLVSGGGGTSGGTALPVFDHFAGHELFLLFPGTTSSTFERIKKKRQEFAMTGVDADINVHLVKAANINFEAAAGPYYYRGYYGRQAVGGKARVTARWSDYIAGEFAASYDNIFHGRIHGGLSLIYPFGPKIPKKRENPENTCNSYPDLFYDRLVQRVDRAEIIVVDRKRFTKKETFTIAGTTATVSPAIDPDTGLPWNFIFVRSVGGGVGFGSVEGTFGASDPGDGTFENPYTLLADAQAPNSAPHDIIYIYAGTGTTEGYNSGFTMQDYQKMWGAGINHNLTTTVGTVVVPAQDGTPEIGNFFSMLTNREAIQLASNTEIAGLTIIDEDGSGGTIAVYGAGITNALIQNNSFELIGGDSGFFIDNTAGKQSLGKIDYLNNTVEITDNSNGSYAASIYGGTSTINAFGNIFERSESSTGTFGSALDIELGYGQNIVTILNNRLNNVDDGSGTGVILLANRDSTNINATISENKVNGGQFIFDVEADSTNCNITLDLTNNIITFDNNTYTGGTVFYVANYAGTTGTVTVTGNEFTYTDATNYIYVLDIEGYGDSLAATVNDNTVSISNQGEAFYFESGNNCIATLTATGNDFSFNNPILDNAYGFDINTYDNGAATVTLANNTCTQLSNGINILAQIQSSIETVISNNNFEMVNVAIELQNGSAPTDTTNLDALLCNNTMAITGTVANPGYGLIANGSSLGNFFLQSLGTNQTGSGVVNGYSIDQNLGTFDLYPQESDFNTGNLNTSNNFQSGGSFTGTFSNALPLTCP